MMTSRPHPLEIIMFVISTSNLISIPILIRQVSAGTTIVYVCACAHVVYVCACVHVVYVCLCSCCVRVLVFMLEGFQ